MKSISRHAKELGLYPWQWETFVNNLVIHLIRNTQDLNKHQYKIFLRGIKEILNEWKNRELSLYS